MRPYIVVAMLLGILGVPSLYAQSVKYKATAVDIPAHSAEMPIISPGGSIIGISYPGRQIFVQQGDSTQILPLTESQGCVPSAANESDGLTVVAGNCAGQGPSVWYWDGYSVIHINVADIYTAVSGVSNAGIIAGNIFPPGAPSNHAVLWNVRDRSDLPLYGDERVNGRYTTGISNNNLVGLAPQPGTYRIQTDAVEDLPLPSEEWRGESSNESTMSFDGRLAGILSSGSVQAGMLAVVWKDGAIERQVRVPRACEFPNRIDFVSSAADDTILLLCRTQFPNSLATSYVSHRGGNFIDLRQLTSGLPATGHLRISRFSSASGVLVGEVAGNPGIWRLSPVGMKTHATKAELETCTEGAC